MPTLFARIDDADPTMQAAGPLRAPVAAARDGLMSACAPRGSRPAAQTDRSAPPPTSPFAPRRAIAYVRAAAASGIDQIMAGNALAQAFMSHRPVLLRYLRARGAGDDAEDCLQDLWLRAQASGDGGVGDPLAYLYRMAHNLMLDRYRAAQRRRGREANYHDAQDGGGEADDTPAVERVLIARERLREVAQVLSALGSRTDYIFRRHRLDEVTQRDIATELGISLSAVEKQLQKAYRAIAAARPTLADAVRSGAAPRDDVDGRR